MTSNLDAVETDVDLRPEDREVLLQALSEGYFEVPREITLQELAVEQGISDREATKRLARGIATVLAESELDRFDEQRLSL